MISQLLDGQIVDSHRDLRYDQEDFECSPKAASKGYSGQTFAAIPHRLTPVGYSVSRCEAGLSDTCSRQGSTFSSKAKAGGVFSRPAGTGHSRMALP